MLLTTPSLSLKNTNLPLPNAGGDDGENLALSAKSKKEAKKGPKGGAKQQQKGGEQ